MSNRIIFCLGSNIGNRQYYLNKAIQLLIDNLCLKNLKQSSVFENKALLLPNSPAEWDVDFFNIAASADIDLNSFAPIKILEIIKKIEVDLGKIYRGKWAPREIDIDIAIIDNVKVDLAGILQIPHPEIFNRDFFINTIKEIEPDILKKQLLFYN